MDLTSKLEEFRKMILFYLSRKLNIALIPPEVMQISVTYKCNLRCKMCSIYNEISKIKKEPAKEEFYRLIDEAERYKIKELVLTGGEPFIREDIFNVIRYAKSKMMKVIVTTNTTLIDKECAEKIVNSGLDHLHISIDGLEESNDFFRGKGVFKKIIKAVTILKDHKNKKGKGPSLGFACVVTNQSLDDLLSLYRLADELGIDVI